MRARYLGLALTLWGGSLFVGALEQPSMGLSAVALFLGLFASICGIVFCIFQRG